VDKDDPLTRLDPDAAASARRRPAPDRDLDRDPEPRVEPQLVDVRRYRWAIGIIGLAVVIGFSVYGFVSGHHPATTGVPVGQRLHWFAAPLADTDLQGDANLRPTCSPAHHDPRALNLCLDARRGPVAIAFFVPQSPACVHQVDALQTLSQRDATRDIQFLAVAVGTSHARAARLIRAHDWTIPVAYDPDGAVGEQYGVVVCPMAELAARGGIVRARLIGDSWQTAAALAGPVAALAAAPR
jgi:peroxiredoxin